MSEDEGPRSIQAELKCVVENCRKWVVFNNSLGEWKLLTIMFHQARYCMLSVVMKHWECFNRSNVFNDLKMLAMWVSLFSKAVSKSREDQLRCFGPPV